MGCSGKNQYQTALAAYEAAVRGKRRGVKLSVYYCHECWHYHLTSKQ